MFHVKRDVERLTPLWMKQRRTRGTSAMFHVKQPGRRCSSNLDTLSHRHQQAREQPVDNSVISPARPVTRAHDRRSPRRSSSLHEASPTKPRARALRTGPEVRPSLLCRTGEPAHRSALFHVKPPPLPPPWGQDADRPFRYVRQVAWAAWASGKDLAEQARGPRGSVQVPRPPFHVKHAAASITEAHGRTYPGPGRYRTATG